MGAPLSSKPLGGMFLRLDSRSKVERIMKIIRIVIILIAAFTSLVIIALFVIFPPDRVDESFEISDVSGPYLGQNPPGTSAERFAHGIIHADAHTAVVFSPDGDEVYWRPMDDGIIDEILYMRMQEGEWTAPDVVPFASRFSDSDNPCFSPDGKKLFFTSFRPLKWYAPFDSKERIWYVERTNQGWSKAKPLDPAINLMDLHWQLSVSENGSLYFASEDDIYRSELVNGQYQAPIVLSDGVNTANDDGHPFIAADESYLIFSSNGHPNRVGDYDLFISVRQMDGTWSDAMNLGEGVNSPHQDIYPVVSPDEKYLFFLSSRGGSHSVYWVDFENIKTIISEQPNGG